VSVVKVGETESLDSAIKRFKRKCQKDGIIGDIKKNQEYLKPSVRKKLKREEARKKNR
jgi:small subunit ribosomal protein S21